MEEWRNGLNRGRRRRAYPPRKAVGVTLTFFLVTRPKDRAAALIPVTAVALVPHRTQKIKISRYQDIKISKNIDLAK